MYILRLNILLLIGRHVHVVRCIRLGKQVLILVQHNVLYAVVISSCPALRPPFLPSVAIRPIVRYAGEGRGLIPWQPYTLRFRIRRPPLSKRMRRRVGSLWRNVYCSLSSRLRPLQSIRRLSSKSRSAIRNARSGGYRRARAGAPSRGIGTSARGWRQPT